MPGEGEVPIQQIRSPRRIPIRDRGADSFPANTSFHVEVSHQPVDLPRGDVVALATEQRDHFPSSIYPLRRADGRQQRVDDDRLAEVVRAGLGAGPSSAGSGGDLHALLAQNLADRLNRAAYGLLFVDERDDERRRGSSSPAKRTAASRKIA